MVVHSACIGYAQHNASWYAAAEANQIVALTGLFQSLLRSPCFEMVLKVRLHDGVQVQLLEFGRQIIVAIQRRDQNAKLV
jgi:hypothetical protein